jgi:hypothetical protein
MSRARWAAWGLVASLGLASGCCTLGNRPFFRPCCSTGACPSGACASGDCAPECEGCAQGLPVSEGPALQDYGVPPGMTQTLPPGALPPGVLPPGATTVPQLSPQPTVPPLSPPPDRLVPHPAQPEPYRP